MVGLSGSAEPIVEVDLAHEHGHRLISAACAVLSLGRRLMFAVCAPAWHPVMARGGPTSMIGHGTTQGTMYLGHRETQHGIAPANAAITSGQPVGANKKFQRQRPVTTGPRVPAFFPLPIFRTSRNPTWNRAPKRRHYLRPTSSQG